MDDIEKIRRNNDKRNLNKFIDVFIGMISTSLSNGYLTTSDAKYYLQWLNKHKPVASSWLIKDLYEYLYFCCREQNLTPKNELKLLNLIEKIIGAKDFDELNTNPVTSIPFCKNPPKEIIIKNNKFVLTGKFEKFKRKLVEQYIINEGGIIAKTPSKNTRYLVVGNTGNIDWAHTVYGRKIENGVRVRETWGNKVISILREDNLYNCIDTSKIKEL